jgi:hypothetical protein
MRDFREKRSLPDEMLALQALAKAVPSEHRGGAAAAAAAAAAAGGDGDGVRVAPSGVAAAVRQLRESLSQLSLDMTRPLARERPSVATARQQLDELDAMFRRAALADAAVPAAPATASAETVVGMDGTEAAQAVALLQQQLELATRRCCLMQAEHSAELSALRDQHAIEMAHHESARRDLEAEWNNKLAAQAARYEAELASMKAAREAQMEQSQVALAALTGAAERRATAFDTLR